MFSEQNIKICKKTLQVHSYDYKKIRRTSSFASFDGIKAGSLSFEAAIIMPVFILMMCAFFWFMMVFRVQMEIQAVMWEVSEELSGYAYLYEQLRNLNSEEAEYVRLSDTGLERWGASAISQVYIENALIAELDEKEGVWKYIKNGMAGLKVNGMLSIPDSGGIIDFAVVYTVQNPFLPGDIGELTLKQRCYVKAWLGFDYRDEEEPETMVYVTENGEVYHLSRECTYLKPSVMLAAYNMGIVKVGSTLYSPCKICMSDSWLANLQFSVYITESGTKYHKDTSCSSLKRTVYELTLEEAEKSYRCCKKCDKESGE